MRQIICLIRQRTMITEYAREDVAQKAGQVSPVFWRIGESVEQGEENQLGLIARERMRL